MEQNRAADGTRFLLLAPIEQCEGGVWRMAYPSVSEINARDAHKKEYTVTHIS